MKDWLQQAGHAERLATLVAENAKLRAEIAAIRADNAELEGALSAEREAHTVSVGAYTAVLADNARLRAEVRNAHRDEDTVRLDLARVTEQRDTLLAAARRCGDGAVLGCVLPVNVEDLNALRAAVAAAAYDCDDMKGK